MKSKSLVILLAAFAPLAAFAQCAPGIPGAGNPGCIPPSAPNSPYNQNGSPPPSNQPEGRWEDRWGSVAMDPHSGRAGVAEKLATKSAARSAAIDQCRSNGGSDCRELLTYQNQCVAVAQNRGGGPVDAYSAAQENDAAAGVLKKCGGTQACQVVYQACSYQQRVD